MKPTRTAALAAIALMALLVTGASADRKPTRDERRAIAKVVELPAACAKVRISTVTSEPEWASVYWKPHPKDKCMPYARDGVAIERYKNGHWKFITAGSSYTCRGLYRDVPRDVAKDLGIDCYHQRAARGYYTDCGTQASGAVIHTKAHGVGCRVARHVGRRYVKRGDTTPLGFTCTEPVSTSPESIKGTCERGSAKVKVRGGV
jgi:hypothetical protein